mmetsp:Transcript_26896/g.55874  ORF Transcript_26896/g.55874 Transcript_26896/m.55874 type:complete len:270 (+) Transcript_26896:3-812(+)
MALRGVVSESPIHDPWPKQDHFTTSVNDEDPIAAALAREAEGARPGSARGRLHFALPRGCLWSDFGEDDLALMGDPVKRPSGIEGDVPVQALTHCRKAIAPKTLDTATVNICHPSQTSTQRRLEGPSPGPEAAILASHTSYLKKLRKHPNDKDIPMQQILNTLESVEQDRAMIVRKIKKLGFKSASLLRAHFEQFGGVERVYVSHSHLQTRTRPASLGFIVMDSKEGSRAALAVGPEQVVGACTISVKPFRQLDRSKEKPVQEEEEEEE